MNSSKIFEGKDLLAWINHFGFRLTTKYYERVFIFNFRLPINCLEALQELGATETGDLIDIYSDPELLQCVEKALKKLEYKKFLKAGQSTKGVAEAIPAFAMPMNPPPQYASSTMPPMPPTPPIIPSESELERLLREKERLLAATSSVSRIEDLQRKLREVEAATMAKSLAKEKAEKEIKGRIAATEKRKKLIEGFFSIFIRLRMNDFQILSSLAMDLDSVASLDICICMDLTGSMSAFIRSAKDSIYELVTSLETIYPHIPLRLAFVGYRDHCDGDNRLKVLAFTPSIPEFRAFVGKESACGGGDDPEDVFG